MLSSVTTRRSRRGSSPPSPCAPSSSVSPPARRLPRPAGPGPALAAHPVRDEARRLQRADRARRRHPEHRLGQGDDPHVLRRRPATASPTRRSRRTSARSPRSSTARTPTSPRTPRPASPPSSSTSTTRRSGPTTWRTGRCTSTSTRPSRTPGSRSRSSRPCPAWSSSSTRPRRWATPSSGITGRNNDQEAATVANLTKVGYGATFNADNFFTKWTASRQHPAVVHHVRHDQLHDRRVQGRHARVPPERRGRSATTSSSTSATSGPTSRADPPPGC